LQPHGGENVSVGITGTRGQVILFSTVERCIGGRFVATALRVPDDAGVSDLPAIYLAGARLHSITERQCVDWVVDSLDAGRGGSVSTMNLDHLRRFAHDPNFAAMYVQSSIVTADGMPLVWASRLRGTPLPQRVTGSNLIWSLTAGAERRGRSIFLLGGAPGAAQRAAAVLAGRHPKLRIAGVSSQPDEFSGNDGQWKNIAAELSAARPDIVYVAVSCPRQQELIVALRETLPAAWWVGVGMAFSFVAGTMPRAPLWMQQAGLEWFHRLLKEPRRLAPRYLILGLPFAVKLFRAAALERLAVQRNLRKP
jgi:N-acetylglucosaminyldiphosphoundecaprenol N-acetyl-beta-D-mannosaminyltransferase